MQAEHLASHALFIVLSGGEWDAWMDRSKGHGCKVGIDCRTQNMYTFIPLGMCFRQHLPSAPVSQAHDSKAHALQTTFLSAILMDPLVELNCVVCGVTFPVCGHHHHHSLVF